MVAYGRIVEWFRENGVAFEISASIDDALADWMQDAYAEGMEAHIGSTGLAALAYMHPALDRTTGYIPLPEARLALKGWMQQCPARARLGWPEELLALVVMAMLTVGAKLNFSRQRTWEMALCTWLAVGCYWRPGEPLRLLVSDLVPPIEWPGRHHMWSIRLHPAERMEPSKTGSFDDSILLDKAPYNAVGPLLMRLKAGKQEGDRAFQFSSPQWSQLVAAAVAHLGLSRKLVLYQLRHSGASNDFYHQRRGLVDIKRRGRWLTDKSVRRYEKAARLTEQLHSLPPSLRKAAETSVSKIPRVLAAF
jgi:hypothetical protein